MFFPRNSCIKVLIWIFVHGRNRLIKPHPKVLGLRPCTIKKLIAQEFQRILIYLRMKHPHLLLQRIILMLNVWNCIGIRLLIVEEWLDVGLDFLRLYKEIPFNTIRKPIRCQWRGYSLIPFHRLLHIAGIIPSIKDIITLVDISNHAGYIFGQVVLIKPHWVELNLIPSYCVNFSRW